jgi:hypothetical protein
MVFLFKFPYTLSRKQDWTSHDNPQQSGFGVADWQKNTTICPLPDSISTPIQTMFYPHFSTLQSHALAYSSACMSGYIPVQCVWVYSSQIINEGKFASLGD